MGSLFLTSHAEENNVTESDRVLAWVQKADGMIHQDVVKAYANAGNVAAKGEKLTLGPKRPKELPEGRLRIANSSKFVHQAHRVQARALQGGKVL